MHVRFVDIRHIYACLLSLPIVLLTLQRDKGRLSPSSIELAHLYIPRDTNSSGTTQH